MSQGSNTYTERGFHIPAHLLEGLERYIKYGEVPGDFLSAVIENDLKEAVGRADSEVIQNLPAYVFFLYNKAPQGCWGSREKLRAWIAKFDTEQL